MLPGPWKANVSVRFVMVRVWCPSVDAESVDVEVASQVQVCGVVGTATAGAAWYIDGCATPSSAVSVYAPPYSVVYGCDTAQLRNGSGAKMWVAQVVVRCE